MAFTFARVEFWSGSLYTTSISGLLAYFSTKPSLNVCVGALVCGLVHVGTELNSIFWWATCLCRLGASHASYKSQCAQTLLIKFSTTVSTLFQTNNEQRYLSPHTNDSLSIFYATVQKTEVRTLYVIAASCWSIPWGVRLSSLYLWDSFFFMKILSNAKYGLKHRHSRSPSSSSLAPHSILLLNGHPAICTVY